jgi:hypothetical protein
MTGIDVRGMRCDLWRISFVLAAVVLLQTYKSKM